uniref:hypothetical protein n=1 Tax=Legionella yabuuchiae TaxID=376727 RepID=UPI00105599A3
MHYLALNQQQLSRFSHHWFWGLRADISCHYNLGNAAADLEKDVVLRQRCEEKIARIIQRTWIIRAFYWFFNISQYRTQYYQLQAYYADQLYKKGVIMLSETEQERIHAAGAFIVTTAAGSLVAKWLIPYLKPSLAW